MSTEDSDSEEDLAESRARQKRILRLKARLDIPDSSPITQADLAPEARAARTARIRQLLAHLGLLQRQAPPALRTD